MKNVKTKSKKNISKSLDTAWSKLVRDKFNHKCAVCGATPVQAHHIFTRGYKSTRWDIDNGIALCYKHHFYLAHSKFEEFRDFVIDLMGEEQYNDLKKRSQEIYKPSPQDLEELLEKLPEKIS